MPFWGDFVKIFVLFLFSLVMVVLCCTELQDDAFWDLGNT